MDVPTLVIGFVPLEGATAQKPKQLREDTYMKELFAQFDLGTLHYTSQSDWKTKVDEVNPLFIILLGHDYYATEVREYKKDAMLFTTYDAGQIFYRKAKMEEKKIKHCEMLDGISKLVQKVREDGEQEVEAVRKYAAMSFDDMYGMIKKGMLSEDKDLKQQAWDLLFGDNVKGDFIWMRTKFLADTWDHADGKGKEELMCMAMEQHVEGGVARKLDIFTDADGQQYHQYMFCHFNGYDLNYIRRIPFGQKGQDKYAYEALISEETPKNFVRVVLEAGQMREQKEKYFKEESEKVARVLREWKENPHKTMRELMVQPHEEGIEDEPMTERELGALKRFLERHNQSAYDTLFG